MNGSPRPLRVLRLVDGVRETSAAYNQFCLPWTDKHKITLCTFFKPQVLVPQSITIFPGDGSVRGIYSAMKKAFADAEYDVIHVHSLYVAVFYLAGMIFLRPKTTLNQTVLTIHSSFPNYRIKHKLMLIPIMLFFGRIICCGNSSFKSVPRFYRWLAGKRLSFIANGVNAARIDSVTKNLQKCCKKRPFTIVAVGRLINVKNPVNLVRAFSRCHDCESNLIFIGEGDIRVTITSEVKKLGLEQRVKITGEIKRDEVYQYLVKADLFVSTSMIEGLPVAVLEAMVCRCPVILSDIPPHREIADGADFIPLVNPGDVNGFAAEISRFKWMQPEERKKIGEKCRKHVLERFSLTSMFNSYERLFIEVMKQPEKGI